MQVILHQPKPILAITPSKATTMAITKLHLCLILTTLSFTLIQPITSTRLRRAVRTSSASTASQFLNTQNVVRAKHNVPPLVWSTKLANYAKWWANQRRGDCALVHSSGNLGENIFWGKGNKWIPPDAVAAWAAQEAYYDYDHNQCMPNRECLHYTQVVWRSTREVGCAKIKCNSGDTYVVCEYYPHGNVIGQRPY